MKRKKPYTQCDSNPWLLCHEACALPQSYNPCHHENLKSQSKGFGREVSKVVLPDLPSKTGTCFPGRTPETGSCRPTFLRPWLRLCRWDTASAATCRRPSEEVERLHRQHKRPGSRPPEQKHKPFRILGPELFYVTWEYSNFLHSFLVSVLHFQNISIMTYLT